MKRRFALPLVLAVLTLAMGISYLSADQPADKEWKKFEGAWFEILHPVTFTVEPSLKSTTNTNGHDSAFFVSPAKDVAFYVFSPQWNGDPTDILLNAETEKQLAFEETEKDGKKVRTSTIVAKDGSYTRSYEDVEDPETNTRRVFGIKYRDQKVFEQYQAQYKRFQESLVQFAD